MTQCQTCGQFARAKADKTAQLKFEATQTPRQNIKARWGMVFANCNGRNEMYDEKEHTRLIAVKQRILDLHAIIQEQAKLASNPEVEKLMNDAADDLDAWSADSIAPVLKIIEDMEYDDGVPEYLREQRILTSAYGRR